MVSVLFIPCKVLKTSAAMSSRFYGSYISQTF